MSESRLKEMEDCGGNREKCTLAECPLYGVLGVAGRDGKRRVKKCGDPVARGKRNRSKGDAKARRARKMLGIAGANTRHEEHWGGAFRIEVKAGKQVEAVWTRYKSAEQQSEAHRPIGDPRPFLLVVMPDGSQDGLIVGRLSSLGTVLRLLNEDGTL